MTSEFEITHEGLPSMLYDATKDSVNYTFRTSVERFEQDGENVTVFIDVGTEGKYDLVFGADG